VAIESKSFDFDIVRTEEDLLRISENGRGRRFSLLLLEQVSLWLLRAWGRFCKSKSPFWCNQLCEGSSSFLLESKRNQVGKLLQLFVIKKGQRSFIIFAAGWNDRGWARISDALKEIISPPNKGSGGARVMSSSQGALLYSVVPPPPLGCYPPIPSVVSLGNHLVNYLVFFELLARLF